MDEVAEQVSNAEALLSMRETAKEIPVIDSVVKYAIAYVTATHAEGNSAGGTASKYIRLGASPRAGQMLITAAKVRALMNGRYNVSYADIDALAHPVLRHRIKLSMEAIAERKTPDMLLDEIANEVRKTVGGKGK